MLEATEEEPTPLQKEVARIGRMLGIAVVVIAVVVVATVLLISDIRSAARCHHRAAARRVAGGGGGARGPAGDPVGRARDGRAAHGEAQRHREEAVVGGDAGLRLGDLLGQDRHADALGDDHRARDDRLGRHPRHRRRLRAEGRVEHEGASSSDGPLLAEDIVVLSGGSLAGNADLRQTASGELGDPGRSHRGGVPGGRAQAGRRPSGASGASSACARSRSPPSAR